MSGTGQARNIFNSGKEFIASGSKNQKIEWSKITETLLPIANIAVAIASVVFVIVGMILGIKYMIAGADEKAGIKQKFVWFVVAIVLVYGAAGIYNMAVGIMKAVTGEN